MSSVGEDGELAKLNQPLAVLLDEVILAMSLGKLRLRPILSHLFRRSRGAFGE
jgi:hypothetical protein